MPFSPDQIPSSAAPYFEDVSSEHHAWLPCFSHGCTFNPELFCSIMMNMVRNPNLNSSWLFRADILYDDEADDEADNDDDDDNDDDNDGGNNQATTTTAIDTRKLPEYDRPVLREIPKIPRQRTLVRRLIPRSEKRDKPMNQTCTFHRAQQSETSVTTLVIYTPHVSSLDDLPFYHPKVRGIAHLHQWNPETAKGIISVHFLGGPDEDDKQRLQDPKIRRVAFHLLEILHKHGQGSALGYVKRVHHDVVLPQARFQDRYGYLKSKYARQLVESWAEATDPGKHVFEDLGIAAFLIELWTDMYKNTNTPFPGFVDLGCGNGLLVYLLTQEGYDGWGFDARARKSWANYTTPSGKSPSGKSLEEKLLLPSVVSCVTGSGDADDTRREDISNAHDGRFEPGTFIVSNHADELTPWTPILAAMSQCPFIMIPCCSHNLTGDRFRAPAPRDKSKSKSTYASLVDWVSQIAEDCGWQLETEMLRIPSTRNTGILGRRRTSGLAASDLDVEAVLAKYGGVKGYYANVAKLVKIGPRGH
ncbi:tRNA(Ser) Um(44) 2'-O-methyltransferase [Conoideocrella luteorostrata]|uniref:tRNA (uracil-O(2)-)-methyltransferase n=1 Tax=Conoideocrella luteorostrata TaxID=1105319 RepID=A0AAJ0CE89_9HYPO|nr:tRNA(Ser) Um(44) 2'-O-methyltransferase [Conoideocrella luteorostrata]